MDTSNSPLTPILQAVLRPQVLRITAIILGALSVLMLGIVAAGTHAGGQEIRAQASLPWGRNEPMIAMVGVITRIWVLSTLACVAGVILAIMNRMLAAGACLLVTTALTHWLLGAFMRASDGGDAMLILVPALLAGLAASGAYYLTKRPFAVPEPATET